jgi:hypothetical protein
MNLIEVSTGELVTLIALAVVITLVAFAAKRKSAKTEGADSKSKDKNG